MGSINIRDLHIRVDHEIQWLNYYALSRSRSDLKITDPNPYDILKDIGYSKVTTDLKLRCAHCTLTNGEVITNRTNIDTLKVDGVGMYYAELHYTPLEIYWIMYPEDRESMINRLRPSDEIWRPWILTKDGYKK